MFAKTLNEQAPVHEPAPPSSPYETPGEPPAVSPPCAELGEQFRNLQQA
jgi:hypothetical protein